MAVSQTEPRTVGVTRTRSQEPPGQRRGWPKGPTVILLLGAVYTLFPVAWIIIAATKSGAELFSTFTLAPGTGLAANVRELLAYRDGLFWTWMLNSALYAGGGAVLSALVSGVTGYAIAKYRFPGRQVIFTMLLAGVLVPEVTLAVPQYLLLSNVGLADTYWAVLLPSLLSPYGVYLARIYAQAAVPDEMMEAARIDRASEWRIFRSLAVRVMMPGLITIFLLRFVAIWNNFLLPFIMLSDDGKFPLTVGLYTLLVQGAQRAAAYNLVITGSVLSVIPLVALFVSLQRYWRIDLLSGGVKG
jgi:multiple sugar transport system permease protein